MTSHTDIFDREQVHHNRCRAACQKADGDFLRNHIAAGISERLEEIKRDFSAILDHGGQWHRHQTRFTPSAITVLSTEPPLQHGEGKVVTADESNIPVPAASFDLVVSNLVLHWINDLPGTLIQVNRALRPDGLFLGTLFGGATLTELRSCLIEAEADITGGASPRVAPFGDIRDLGGLMQRAGFALPVADLETVTVSYEHPLKLMQDLRAMGETNAMVDRSRKFLRRDVLMKACEIYLKKHQQSDGRVKATFDIIYLTGWHPHESQQKPLKPGSGKVSLADALSGKIKPK